MEAPGRALMALVLTIVLGPIACGPAAPPPREVLIFGIDGATWDVIDPLIARGELPNLARLRQRGVSGPLTSLAVFDQSIVIWNSLSTGVVPERHGIVDFVRWNEETGRAEPISSAERRVPAFWNLLDRHGLPTGVIGHWATWPAEALAHPDSFLLSDRILTATPSDLSWPRSLVEELDLPALLARHPPPPRLVQALEEVYDLDAGALLDTGWSHLENGFDTLRFVIEQDRVKVHGGLRLLTERRPALLFTYVRVVDVAQHFLWADERGLLPGSLADGVAVREAYRAVDEQLGLYLEALGPDAHVLVVSDHGGMARDTPINVLARADTAAWLGLGDQAVVDPKWYRRLGVHLLVEGRDEGGQVAPGDLPRERAALRDRLLALRTTEGQPVLFADEDPLEDLLFKWNTEAFTLDTEIALDGRTARLVDLADIQVRTGQHARDGILAATGPAFRSGVRLTEAGVLDVLPTLMVLLGLPVAEDLDGGPLLEAFEPAFLAAHPMRRVASYGGRRTPQRLIESVEDRQTLRQLEALGYLERPAADR